MSAYLVSQSNRFMGCCCYFVLLAIHTWWMLFVVSFLTGVIVARSLLTDISVLFSVWNIF